MSSGPAKYDHLQLFFSVLFIQRTKLQWRHIMFWVQWYTFYVECMENFILIFVPTGSCREPVIIRLSYTLTFICYWLEVAEFRLASSLLCLRCLYSTCLCVCSGNGWQRIYKHRHWYAVHVFRRNWFPACSRRCSGYSRRWGASTSCIHRSVIVINGNSCYCWEWRIGDSQCPAFVNYSENVGVTSGVRWLDGDHRRHSGVVTDFVSLECKLFFAAVAASVICKTRFVKSMISPCLMDTWTCITSVHFVVNKQIRH